MVPWWKRLLFFMLSAVFAAAIVGAAWYCWWGGMRMPGEPFLLPAFAIHIVVTIFLSLHGWIIGIPIVLAIRDYSGARLWWILPVGACIGPLCIGTLDFYQYAVDTGSGSFGRQDAVNFILAGMVSALGTAIYAFLVLRAQRRKIGDTESASPQISPV